MVAAIFAALLSAQAASAAPAVSTSQAQTYTTYLPMSQEECAYLHQTQPAMACQNAVTTHVDATQPLAASAVPPEIRASAGQAVQANAWTTRYGWTELCGPACFLWHSKVATQYIYNGIRVWQRWVDCSDHGGTGYNVSIDWCGYWNNGGYNIDYMNMGDNITVSFVYNGSPVHRGYWQRFNVAVNGSFWLCGSGRSTTC